MSIDDVIHMILWCNCRGYGTLSFNSLNLYVFERTHFDVITIINLSNYQFSLHIKTFIKLKTYI